MDSVVATFFGKRQTLIDNTRAAMKLKHGAYLVHREETRRKLAVIISVLTCLKFELERSADSDFQKIRQNHLKVWDNLRNRMADLEERASGSKAYCVYRSPSRECVDVNAAKISSEYCRHVSIKTRDLETRFQLDTDVDSDTAPPPPPDATTRSLNAKVKHNTIQLHIDDMTSVDLPKSYVQMPEDTISVEYADMFYSRSDGGVMTGHKYKGFDRGKLHQMYALTTGSMTLENIEKALELGFEVLA